MDEDEQDVYVAQLHEVFDSCDHARKGFLNRNELVELCKKLQIDNNFWFTGTNFVATDASNFC